MVRIKLRKNYYTMLFVWILLGLLLPSGLAARGTKEIKETLDSSGSSETSAWIRIGTTQTVRTAAPFGDYNLGIFTKISNPPLMTMNEEGKIVGLTAEGYEVSEDHTVWTFHLRKGFVWSDGLPLTARDVVFSIQYTGEKNPNAGWIARTLKETRTPDEYTAVFIFTKPYTNLDLEFCSYNILPAHVWSRMESPLSYKDPDAYIGHGPFVIERIDLSRGILRFHRNPHWKGTSPHIQGYEIRIFQSMDTLALMLEKGELDLFYNYAASYPYPYLEKLYRNPKFRFEERLNQGLLFLGFNLKKPLFQDPRIRKAIAAAIRYEEVLKLDGLGYGEVPNRGFVPPSMEHYIPTAPLRHDLATAVSLLEEAGYNEKNKDGIRMREGKPLQLELLVRPEYQRVGELIQIHLKEAGIGSTLRLVDANTWFKLKDEYEYDLTITRTTPWGMLMHAGWGTGYFDSRRTGQGVLHTLDDPRFLSLCDQVLSTTDKIRISQLAREIQKYYEAELPAIPLYWNKIVIPYLTTLEGVRSSPLFGIYTIDNFLSIRKR